MPPRHAYWTILIGDSPTAFRARERDELAPTFERLRAKQPDAVIKWFERGRLWASPEEARGGAPAAPRERRGPEWRPGGAQKAHEHPAVQELWGAMAAVADFPALGELPEAGRRFPHFSARDGVTA